MDPVFCCFLPSEEAVFRMATMQRWALDKALWTGLTFWMCRPGWEREPAPDPAAPGGGASSCAPPPSYSLALPTPAVRLHFRTNRERETERDLHRTWQRNTVRTHTNQTLMHTQQCMDRLVNFNESHFETIKKKNNYGIRGTKQLKTRCYWKMINSRVVTVLTHHTTSALIIFLLQHARLGFNQWEVSDRGFHLQWRCDSFTQLDNQTCSVVLPPNPKPSAKQSFKSHNVTQFDSLVSGEGRHGFIGFQIVTTLSLLHLSVFHFVMDKQ